MPTSFTAIPTIEARFSRTLPVIRDGDRVVADSFDIAVYLDETYPDRPSLLGGEGGKALARFMESWCRIVIQAYILPRVVTDIHAMLAPVDQVYFRESREKRLGARLEDVGSSHGSDLAAFGASLEPLRAVLALQPFLGGQTPLFADYIVAGAFQWARIVSSRQFLDPGDTVAAWFDRCLDLNGNVGRCVAPAASPSQPVERPV